MNQSNTERVEALPDTKAEIAAQILTNNWESASKIINGYVEQTLIPEYCTVVKTMERGEEVLWHVSKGAYTDEKGHVFQLAGMIPPKKRYDMDYMLSSARIILDGNVGNFVGTIVRGQVLNDDDEISHVLELEPAGYEDLIRQIYESSRSRFLLEQKEKEQRSEEHKRLITKTVRRLIIVGAAASTVIFGVPRAIDELDQREARIDAQKEAEAQELATYQAALEAERQAEIAEFDAKYTDITDAVIATDGDFAVLPSTTEFSSVSEIPQYDESLTYTQLEHVRSFTAPAIGQTMTYSLSIPEGAQFKIAHTGDSDLLVVAQFDSQSQMLTISSVDIFPQNFDVDGNVIPTQRNLGEIAVTIAP